MRGPDVTFPLTLTLSLREREPPPARLASTNELCFADRLTRMLPLPKGEGWGEGEWVELQPHMPDDCKNHQALRDLRHSRSVPLRIDLPAGEGRKGRTTLPAGVLIAKCREIPLVFGPKVAYVSSGIN